MGVRELFARARPETRRLVTDILEQDASDDAWSRQVGHSLTQTDVARLLGKSEQATSKDPRLLRLWTRSGRVAYPIVQFAGRGQVQGVAHVVRLLGGVVEPLTVAAWLTASNPDLGDRRPVDALRDGDLDPVLALARRLARGLS